MQTAGIARFCNKSTSTTWKILEASFWKNVILEDVASFWSVILEDVEKEQVVLCLVRSTPTEAFEAIL